MKNLSLPQILLNANAYFVISNGENYELKDDVFFDMFSQLLTGSYFSPSFVKFNHENVQNKKLINIWLELSYNYEQEYAQSSFSKLLISIDKDLEELIIIRQLNEFYQEKGYLLTLNKDTNKLYNYLLKLTQPNRSI